MSWFSATLIVLTFVGIAAGHVPGLMLNRAGIALLGTIALMVFGGVSTADAIRLVDWPTVFLLFGLFVIAAQLRLCGVYDAIAEAVAALRAPPSVLLAALMGTTALLSAVINHDIVCYLFTPIVCTALARRRLDPVPFAIGLAVASNLGSALTLIGSAQNLLIGEARHLSFGGYSAWAAVPTLASLAGGYALILPALRRSAPPIQAGGAAAPAPVPLDQGHAIKGLVILGCVIGAFFTDLPKEVVVLGAAGIHLASPKFRTEDLLALVDWPLLVLFVSLFVVTGDFAASGGPGMALQFLHRHGIDLSRPAGEIGAAALLSNLVGNAPAVMLLLKLVPGTGASGYLLATANSFGASALLTGSVANLIVVQQARNCGVEIRFGRFLTLGVPVAATSLALLIVWAKLTL